MAGYTRFVARLSYTCARCMGSAWAKATCRERGGTLLSSLGAVCQHERVKVKGLDYKDDREAHTLLPDLPHIPPVLA